MMTCQSEYIVPEPGPFVYLIAVVLAAGVSCSFATYLLELSPAWLSLSAGGVCGALGLAMGENVGEALVFSLILALLVFLFIKVGPEIEFIRIAIVPIAAGFCMGELVGGIWKEIS
ncbi:MAG: hypothetical protein ABFS18_14065 [Thermodesulfobacteriota bacterium]